MSETTVSQGRRRSAAFRNLDDTLKIAGVISLKSCGLLLIGFAFLHTVQSLTGVFDLLWRAGGFFLELALVALGGVALSWAERQEDEHFVVSALRYYLSAPWLSLYSGGYRLPMSQSGPTLKEVLER